MSILHCPPVLLPRHPDPGALASEHLKPYLQGMYRMQQGRLRLHYWDNFCEPEEGYSLWLYVLRGDGKVLSNYQEFRFEGRRQFSVELPFLACTPGIRPGASTATVSIDVIQEGTGCRVRRQGAAEWISILPHEEVLLTPGVGICKAPEITEIEAERLREVWREQWSAMGPGPAGAL